MKYLPLVWAALRRKPARTLLTCFSIVTAFFLFGTLQGINVGIAQIMRITSVTHLVVMSRVTAGAPMPLAHVAQIRSVPGVTAVAPFNVVVGTYQRPNNPLIIIGTDFDAFMQINSEIIAPADQAAALRRTRNGLIVGVAAAKQYGWKIGDRVPVHGVNGLKTDGTSDWVFDVVGLYTLQQPDWATRIFANYDFINEALTSGKNQSVEFYVGISDPAKSTAISQAIDDRFANSPDQTTTANEKDFLETTLRQIGDINYLVNGVVGAVLFTLLFLTSNTIAQSVRERTAELAVLKTLGFTDGGVQWLVLTEALILAMVSAALGVALASVVLPWVTSGPALASQGIGAMHVPGLVYGAAAVIGTAGVVAVLLSVLALSTGLADALTATGSADRAIVLHAQASNEIGSNLAHDAVPTILDAPGIAKDSGHAAIASAEALASVNLPRLDNGKLDAMTLRGVSPSELLQLRPEIHMVQGRMFQSGLRELIVGKSAQGRYANLSVGSHVKFGDNEWTIVGAFESGGGAHDSEVMGDIDTVLAAYQRGTYNSVIVKLDGQGALERLRAALTHDPTLSVQVFSESDYYARQSQTFARVLALIARVISIIMAIGAVFAALNTMYSAVSSRAVEIATLRAIGYGALGVVTSVIIEALLLSVLGALVGAALAWVVFNGNTVSTISGSSGLAQIVFRLHIGAALITLGIIWACVVGLIGGLLPAIRAARIPVALALRAI